jgi:hypothetical protein
MSPNPWQEAFIGMSMLLGEPLDESLGALDEPARAQLSEIAAALRSVSREARARAMAIALVAAAAGIDDLELR